MRLLIIFLCFGILVFLAGWAIRSTFIMHGYSNKPIGGAMVAAGFLVMGVSVWRILKNR